MDSLNPPIVRIDSTPSFRVYVSKILRSFIKFDSAYFCKRNPIDFKVYIKRIYDKNLKYQKIDFYFFDEKHGASALVRTEVPTHTFNSINPDILRSRLLKCSHKNSFSYIKNFEIITL